MCIWFDTVICNHLQLSKSRSCWDTSRDPDLLLWQDELVICTNSLEMHKTASAWSRSSSHSVLKMEKIVFIILNYVWVVTWIWMFFKAVIRYLPDTHTRLSLIIFHLSTYIIFLVFILRLPLKRCQKVTQSTFCKKISIKLVKNFLDKAFTYFSILKSAKVSIAWIAQTHH